MFSFKLVSFEINLDVSEKPQTAKFARESEREKGERHD